MAMFQFYEELRDQRDPSAYGSIQSRLRNAHSVVYDGLQSTKCLVQLAAADALGCCVMRPYLWMLKQDDIDAINLGPKIWKIYSFLQAVADSEVQAKKLLCGEEVLFNSEEKD